MDTLIALASQYPFVAAAVIVALGILATIVILGFIQGREITLGPLKIGARPEKSGKKEASQPVLNQDGEILKKSPEEAVTKEPGKKEADHPSSKDVLIYPNSDSNKFTDDFERMLRQAEKILLIGTGFSILHRQTLFRLLVERIRHNSSVEIYAANPFSPNVQMRLIEEETGEDTPEIRQKGLINWLVSLLAERERLSDKSKFVLKLFSLYPTYALFIFDKEYFFYPYGYTKLGTLSPVLHFSREEPTHQTMIQFLDQQAERVKELSADANLFFDLRARRNIRPDQLTAFAVYLIPVADTDLYRFGSKIIEYDVRAQKELQPNARLHNAVGAAFLYGLHVTIADALYCAAEADIDLICKEVEFLANEFRPFTINLSLEKDFPNERGIALVCNDETGSLEALHHEMVARVYRKAVASNYNFDPSLADRDNNKERAKLMIKHYHAPYILQRFKPHFSLLSNVPSKEKERIYADVKERYEKAVRDSSIEISRIAVMCRPHPGEHWEILREYSLGGVA